MRPKKYLFCLSLCLVGLAGCQAETKEAEATLAKKLDSMTTRHQVVLDSMEAILAQQRVDIQKFEVQYRSLIDSLGKIPPVKVGPKIRKDEPSGIPIRFDK